MNNSKVSKILNEHLACPFPKDAAESELLADWIFDLGEVDAYYVGWVTSRKSSPDLSALDEMEKRLDSISPSRADRNLYEACRQYLESLKAVVGSLED